PNRHAAREHHPLRQPRGGREIDTGVDIFLLAKMRRLADDIVARAHLAGTDIVKSAELVPSTSRQPWIGGHRDSVRSECGVRHLLGLRISEIPIPPASM